MTYTQQLDRSLTQQDFDALMKALNEKLTCEETPRRLGSLLPKISATLSIICPPLECPHR